MIFTECYQNKHLLQATALQNIASSLATRDYRCTVIITAEKYLSNFSALAIHVTAAADRYHVKRNTVPACYPRVCILIFNAPYIVQLC